MEKSVHEMAQNVFYSPQYTTVAIFDDLNGCRSRNSHAKTLSFFKAYSNKEGHSAEFI